MLSGWTWPHAVGNTRYFVHRAGRRDGETLFHVRSDNDGSEVESKDGFEEYHRDGAHGMSQRQMDDVGERMETVDAALYSRS